MKKTYLALLALTLCALTQPISSDAREYTLSGGVGLYYNHDSNATREKTNPKSQWTSTIAPSLTLLSAGQFDQLSLNYAPGYTYNDRTDQGDVNHQFSVLADMALDKHLNAKIHNSFFQGEDTADRTGLIATPTRRTSGIFVPVEAPPGGEPPPPSAEGVVLSQDRGTNRYWTNKFSIGASHEYAKESYLDLSYSNEILENDDPTLTNYVRHLPGAMIRHRFSPEWSTSLSLDYSKGDFDRGEDLTTTSPGFRVNHHYSPHTTFFADYMYDKADYSGISPDYETHTPSLGYSGSLDAFTALTAQLGAAFTERDNGGNDNGISYTLSLARRLERGRFLLSGSGGQEARNFSGATTTAGATEGLSQYWSLSGSLTQEVWKDILIGCNAGIRGDDLLEETTNSKKTSLDAGAFLSYSFQRYYALSLRYNFRKLDADLDSGDYEAHRVYLSLSAMKDLFKWQ